MYLLATSDNTAIIVALLGIVSTLVALLGTGLGYLIKALINRSDKKDEELAQARIEGTAALNKSSDVLLRAINILDAQEANQRPVSRPRTPAKSSGKRVTR